MKDAKPLPGPFMRPAAPTSPFMAASGSAPAPYRGIDVLDPFHRARATPAPLLPLRPPVRAPKTPEQISHLYELALTSAAMSFHEAALENLREVTACAPDHAPAWQVLAGLLRLAAKDAEADAAASKAVAADGAHPAWRNAEGENRPDQLDRLDRKLKARLEKTPDEERMDLLRQILFTDPLDVVAMRYLANEEEMAEDLITAGNVFERLVTLSPSYVAARADYAQLLMTRREHLAALKQSDHLVASDPNDIRYRLLRADASVHMERFDDALASYEACLKQEPDNAYVLNSYGRVLKTLGRREESVRTFRKLLAVFPASGSAYFGLAELKANYLTAADIVDMRAYLAGNDGEVNERKAVAYALGQALERARDYEGSFAAYAYGARLCKDQVTGTSEAHDPEAYAERLSRIRRTFTREAMQARPTPPDRPVTTTPIFVLGMPRAGSTLVEQILASHSQVEGTRELPVVSRMTMKVAMSRVLVDKDVYPARVLDFDRAELDALGEECLRGIAEYRKTTLPYVIDKRPWNWIDVPFIHLMLPQAKFIDIRRGPMAAGFAMFKQYLPTDAAFSYDLAHLGNYYRRYVEHMDAMEDVMPKRVLHVSYDRLVDDTETEIRRMLDYCGLPFEEGCLRFWETDRAVLTPSAEQVRRPIFRDALEQWKNYEPWLDQLKQGLGPLAPA